MKQSTPVILIIGGAALGIVLMFWALYATNNSPISHRVPASEVTGQSR
jgi:hypothetical protein